jgi:hypothetical protein
MNLDQASVAVNKLIYYTLKFDITNIISIKLASKKGCSGS